MLDLLIHDLDMALHLFGTPDAVAAAGRVDLGAQVDIVTAQLFYPTFKIDIVGGCNARCPFCTTGREDFGKRITAITVPDFARTLDRLMDLGLAVPGVSSVCLYNWGEPVLHPDLNGIVAELNTRKLPIVIATNASKAISAL